MAKKAKKAKKATKKNKGQEEVVLEPTYFLICGTADVAQREHQRLFAMNVTPRKFQPGLTQ